MVDYTYNIIDFPNQKVCLDLLTKEINASSISIALSYMEANSIIVHIYFKVELSVNEKTILDEIIANHSGEQMKPLVDIVNVQILTENSKYVETGTTTQGLFCGETLMFDISSNISTTFKDFSWKLDIALLNACIPVLESMIGDSVEIIIGPDTIIGVNTQQAIIGDSSIYVSSTVIQYIKKGHYLGVYGNGEIGRVIEIGENYLVLDNPIQANIAAGSYITLQVKIIPFLEFNKSGNVEIGKEITTAQRLPKNTKIRIKYRNNSGTQKRIAFYLEYLY